MNKNVLISKQQTELLIETIGKNAWFNANAGARVDSWSNLQQSPDVLCNYLRGELLKRTIKALSDEWAASEGVTPKWHLAKSNLYSKKVIKGRSASRGRIQNWMRPRLLHAKKT